MRRSKTRAYRLLILMATMCMFVVHPLFAAAAPGGGKLAAAPVPLDLGAMVLTPQDLAAEGLDGYGIQQSWTDTFDDEFVNILDGGPYTADDVRQRLTAAAFERSRGVVFFLPSENDQSNAARSVTIWVDQYGQPSGLSDMIDLYLNYGGAKVVQGTTTIGDESRIVSYTQTAGDSGAEIKGLTLVFRSGNEIADIQIADFQTFLPDITPSAKEIEALATRLLARINTVLSGKSPGLDPHVLRLASDGNQVSYLDDWYTRLGGDSLALFGDTSSALQARDSEADQAGIDAIFALDQRINTNSEGTMIWSVRIRHFATEDAAIAWWNDLPTWLTSQAGIDHVVIAKKAPQLGDAALAETYHLAAKETNWQADFVRVGNDVLVVQLGRDGTAPKATQLDPLAQAQVSCMTATSCDAEFPVPDAIIGSGGF
jgi:hypothetical protein